MRFQFDAALARARAGDEAGFVELWRAHQPPLLRYLRVLAPDAADDVASETWLDVCRGLTRFRGDEAGFRAWIFTIARHRLIDDGRRAGRRPPVADGPVPDVAGGDDPADVFHDVTSTAAALAAVASLPPAQAEVVLLRAVAGLDVEHVAQIVGKRPGAVRILAHRGLRRLAERLGTEAVREV